MSKFLGWLAIAIASLTVPVGTTVGIGVTEGWRNGLIAAGMWAGCGVAAAAIFGLIKWGMDRV